MLNGAPRDPNAVVEDPATATRSARVRLWSPLFADAVFHLVSPLSTRNTSHILAHQHHVQGNRGLGFLLADLYRERVTAICVTHSACHGIRLPRRARVTRKIFSSHGACPGFKALSIRFLSVNVVPLSTPSVTRGNQRHAVEGILSHTNILGACGLSQNRAPVLSADFSDQLSVNMLINPSVTYVAV